MNQFLESVRLVSEMGSGQQCSRVPYIHIPVRPGRRRRRVARRDPQSVAQRPCSCRHALPLLPAQALLCRPARAPQGFESVAEVNSALAKVQSRTPWDGGEGAAEEADEFDLADLMKEEL